MPMSFHIVAIFYKSTTNSDDKLCASHIYNNVICFVLTYLQYIAIGSMCGKPYQNSSKNNKIGCDEKD